MSFVTDLRDLLDDLCGFDIFISSSFSKISKMGRLTNAAFLVALAVVQLASVAALLPLCADQFTAATSCWAGSKCLLQEDCDVPDPDPDKSCSEENEMLDEAAACCSDCTATVEAIRQCRGCSSAEDDANSDTGITDNDAEEDAEDEEDDPSTLLKPCSDQLSAVTTCYAANKCTAVPECDAYDPDVDKTCAEEADITDDFQSCCSACAGAAQAVLSCRCPEYMSTTASAGDIDTSDASSVHFCLATVVFGLTLVYAHLW